MRIGFAGTPAFAARALEAILGSPHEVVLVLTRADARAGRGMALTPSPVKTLALRHGIQIVQPPNLKMEADRQVIAEAQLDVLVVAAYGLILPQAVLDMPKQGAVNIHASLLPRWRGAAPIQRAVLAGDAITGISIMQMEAGLDTGPVLLKAETPISAHDTAGSVHDRLAEIGANLIVEALERLSAGPLTATPQEESLVTYASKIQKAEARIDWSRSAADLDRQIRAFNPFPGAVTSMDGVDIKIWRAEAEAGPPVASAGCIIEASPEGIRVACGEGSLRLLELQRAGARSLSCDRFLQGTLLSPGQCLGR
jgi:methionyl-tRNA formyltransferase